MSQRPSGESRGVMAAAHAVSGLDAFIVVDEDCMLVFSIEVRRTR